MVLVDTQVVRTEVTGYERQIIWRGATIAVRGIDRGASRVSADAS